MAKTIIAGNWKMNKTIAEAKKFKDEFIEQLRGKSVTADIVICPPYTLIQTLKGNGFFAVGSQNISNQENGAFTGEISADMLKELKVEYALIGHSERRQYYCENDELINLKVKRTLDAGIIPILCVGESLAERQAEHAISKIEFQIEAGFAGLTPTRAKKMVVAYEPIWAIGTGVTATADQAEEMCFAIRKKLSKLYDSTIADEIPVLYGGSMNSTNARELLSKPNINGGLIGGASLKPDEFAKVVLASNNT